MAFSLHRRLRLEQQPGPPEPQRLAAGSRGLWGKQGSSWPRASSQHLSGTLVLPLPVTAQLGFWSFWKKLEFGIHSCHCLLLRLYDSCLHPSLAWLFPVPHRRPRRNYHSCHSVLRLKTQADKLLIPRNKPLGWQQLMKVIRAESCRRFKTKGLEAGVVN